MTDITILIAVIALALWPLVFLASRIMHERRKRLEHPEWITSEEMENMTTPDLVIATLKQLGCQPEVNEEEHINFKYQGDDFFIICEEEHRLIMIWNPWWASISLDNEALPYLKEIINAVNMNSLATTVYAIDEDSQTIGIHSKCHIQLFPKEETPDKQLTEILDSFFTIHDTIKEGIKQLGNEASGNDQQERIKVKGFAAYRENSTELKTEEEK